VAAGWFSALAGGCSRSRGRGWLGRGDRSLGAIILALAILFFLMPTRRVAGIWASTSSHDLRGLTLPAGSFSSSKLTLANSLNYHACCRLEQSSLVQFPVSSFIPTELYHPEKDSAQRWPNTVDLTKSAHSFTSCNYGSAVPNQAHLSPSLAQGRFWSALPPFCGARAAPSPQIADQGPFLSI